jgi:tRNA dimethylallyltransferase
MQKILVICGPTAIGKTSLALNFANKYNGELLVADSRQVYRGMDIVTGKDIPEGGHFVEGTTSYWETENAIRIWLTDLVNPKKDFSVALWQRSALKILKLLEKEKSLPIIVGGTGLYIKSLSGEIETIGIKPNKTLRLSLSGKTTEELYDMLAQMDSVKAASMNHSDRNNPFRLIRAIEVADAGFKKIKKRKASKYDFLKIGLSCPKEELFNRISLRVDERLKNGAIEETEKMLQQGLTLQNRSMSVFGYKELIDYINGNLSLDAAVSNWKKEEQKYAQRQMTWFKKDKEIKWFDISGQDFVPQVEKEVANWYNYSR